MWTQQETYGIYRQKLERLRNLYMGQLSRLSHLLQDRRRQFLLEWQAAGGVRDKGIYIYNYTCTHNGSTVMYGEGTVILFT